MAENNPELSVIERITRCDQYISFLDDKNTDDSENLKNMQFLSKNLQVVLPDTDSSSSFIKNLLTVFIRVLGRKNAYFFSDHSAQQLRKCLLEIIHHVAICYCPDDQVDEILNTLFDLLKVENEENGLVCLRTIIDLHSAYKPEFNEKVPNSRRRLSDLPSIKIGSFLDFVSTLYSTLFAKFNEIFEPRDALQLHDLPDEQLLDVVLPETYSVTDISGKSEKPRNLIPKATLSFKVLAELPIVVALAHQLYQERVISNINELMPHFVHMVTVEPSSDKMRHPKFNRELFADFMAAKIKTLSFLVHIFCSDKVLSCCDTDVLVKGMLLSFRLCPPEITHLRKELLIAAQYILSTSVREKFIDSLDELFDENILIGTGWTAREALRPSAYGMLADFVHQVREKLSLLHFEKAVKVFSNIIHDETLSTSIQTMSCKLLLNLVDSIGKHAENEQDRANELFLKMMEAFVLKFKTIAKVQLPILRLKSDQSTSPLSIPQQLDNTCPTNQDFQVETKEEKELGNLLLSILNGSKDDKKPKYEFPTQSGSYSITDCKSLVTTLIFGVKKIALAILEKGKKSSEGDVHTQTKLLVPNKIFVFIQLSKYAFKAIDVLSTSFPEVNQYSSHAQPSAVSKDEKEALGLLSIVFTSFYNTMFRDVFSVTIGPLVDCLCNNSALLIITNSFLSNCDTSKIFTEILVQYLLQRMHEMGSNTLRSIIYLELFKQILRGLSLFPTGNEAVLKPYLQQIVYQSMELALTAEDPYNYFALLITLFDSIGKGDHELMFNDFLNMLPNLLERFNYLLSRDHKPKYKDLFVELCLAVPVTLSSWLPYLDKLMYPLLAAVNGSRSLTIQGLSTLDVCATSFQPFASDCLEPVWAELMQTLWRLLRHEDAKISQFAFKVLGKFGGINRGNVMIHPQKLQYNKEDNPLCIPISFPAENLKQGIINLPISKVIEKAYNVLISGDSELFYLENSWEVIKGFLSAMIEHSEDHVNNSFQFFSQTNFNKKLKPVLRPLYKCPDEESRRITELALTGMLVAVSKPKMRTSVVPYMTGLVYHYTILMVGQQSGSYVGGGRFWEYRGMDPLVLLDAVTSALRQGNEELCSAAKWALALIWDTTLLCIRSESEACRLPFLSYLLDSVTSLCYEGGWSSKRGGCIAMQFLSTQMPKKWVSPHLLRFVKALFFVMRDLSGDISVGTVEFAKHVLKDLLITYCTPDEYSFKLQSVTIDGIIQELIQSLISHDAIVRQQAIESLDTLAQTMKTSLPELLAKHETLIHTLIPPDNYCLSTDPIPCQVGMLEAITFCLQNVPNLLEIGYEKHGCLLEVLKTICDLDRGSELGKSPANHAALYQAAFQLLSLYFPLFEEEQKYISSLLYRSLLSSNSHIQEAAFQSMKDLVYCGHIRQAPLDRIVEEFDQEKIVTWRYFIELFHTPMSEEYQCQLWDCLKDHIQNIHIKKDVELCSAIITIFAKTSVDTSSLIPKILEHIMVNDLHSILRVGSPLEEPIISFLSQYTARTVNWFLDKTFLDNKSARFLVYLVKNKKESAFRNYFMENENQLVVLLSIWFIQAKLIKALPSNAALLDTEKMHLALKILNILIKYDKKWIAEHRNVSVQLKQIWKSEAFINCLQNMDLVDLVQWKVPSLLVKCLLNYFENNTDTDKENNIMILFDLLRIFAGRYIPGFEFLREFLQKKIAGTYSLRWKREAFFEFVKVFRNRDYSQDLKAKILQYIIIPCFSTSPDGEIFSPSKDETVSRQGESDSQDKVDIINVFISQVIGADVSMGCSDAVRILLLQLSCLLVEKALRPMQPTKDKSEEKKLRQLMIFAWPCLLTRNCVDPATKYHGHLLLAIIIVKFPIWEKIVLQVFHGLLKAHVPEVRTVVQQALEVLTPIIPHRIDDSNHKLSHWTKKVMVEDGGTLPRLVHLLYLLVRHYKVYKPIRHDLLPHMISSIKRICSMSNVQLEYKKLAVDVAEVIIHWELERPQTDITEEPTADKMKRKKSHSPSKSGDMSGKGHQSTSGKSGKSEYKGKDTKEPMEKAYADSVVNFLLRMACQVNDANITSSGSPGEQLSQRCIILLKTTLKANLWKDTKLNLSWFSKLFATLENQQPNYGNVCTALEFLKFYVSLKEIDNKEVLATIKELQPDLSNCMRNQNLKIIYAMHDFLAQLIIAHPIKESMDISRSSEVELYALYADVNTFISDGLNLHEKSPNKSTTLCGVLMILKAVCFCDSSYIDHLTERFIPMLLIFVNEYLKPPSEDIVVVNTDLLIISLNLVRNRAGILRRDLLDTFMNKIAMVLIEKCTEVKVGKLLIEMVDDWIMTATHSNSVLPPPSSCIKDILSKMVECVEKNFPDEPKLNHQFLKLVYRLYREPNLAIQEYQIVLEPAFLSGLCCSDPHLRAQFIEIDNGQLPFDPFRRLLDIVTKWDKNKIKHRFWIRHCLELMMSLASSSRISCSKLEVVLPPLISILNEKQLESCVNWDPPSISACVDDTFQESANNNSWDMLFAKCCLHERGPYKSDVTFQKLRFSQQMQFLRQLKEQRTIDFLNATKELCYIDTELAESLWLQFFPKIWKLMSKDQQNLLSAEMVAFLCKAQPTTNEVSPDPILVFAESILLCKPMIEISPELLADMGSSLNLWHRSCLLLEKMCDGELISNRHSHVLDSHVAYCGIAHSDQERSLHALVNLYEQLNEDDLFAAICKKHLPSDFSAAVALENQGRFTEAKTKLDKFVENSDAEFQSVKKIAIKKWARCAEQLADWNALHKLSKSEQSHSPLLAVESYFRSRKWDLLKKSLVEVEQTSFDNPAWKLNLFKSYLTVCHPDDKNLSLIEQESEMLSTLCIREWKRLPSIISDSHIPILQSAQQVMELKDAAKIHDYLEQQKFLYMRAIIKKWPDRLPALSDDFSYWTALHSWRDVHTMEIAHFKEENIFSYKQLGLFAYIHSNLTICTQARKQGNPELCLKGLSILRIEEIEDIPAVFRSKKVKQMLKCHLALSRTSDQSSQKSHLSEGLALVKSMNIKGIETKDLSEIAALTGVFCNELQEPSLANDRFMKALELDNHHMKSWAMYGEFLEEVFMRTRHKNEYAYRHGELAVIAYMNCCQFSKESMSRKYIAKTLWLLTFDDKSYSLSKQFMESSLLVAAHHWMPWLPQLIACMGRPEGIYFSHLLCHLGCKYPSAVYFPLCSLYESLEARGKIQIPTTTMVILNNIRQSIEFMQRIRRSTVCTLGRIRLELSCFEENIFESMLQKLRQLLQKSYAIMFSESSAGCIELDSALSTMKSLFDSYVKINIKDTVYNQDPVYKKMNEAFNKDFRFEEIGPENLMELIDQSKKWITNFEARAKFLPKSLMMNERFKFLSEFIQEMAELEIPGELLIPRTNVHCVMIAQFMPKVDIVHKHRDIARRLYIRGHNGKIYPYLIVHHDSAANARSEERILQLFRFVNTSLLKQKETLRRCLNLTIPRVTPLDSYIQIVEDDVESLSLYDIYQKYCEKQKMDPDKPLLSCVPKRILKSGAKCVHQKVGVSCFCSQPFGRKRIDVLKIKNNQNLVPKTLFKDWALQAYTTATEYWTFRKQFTLQHSLVSFFEYCLHLNCLTPQMMCIHPDTGNLSALYFHFNLDERGKFPSSMQPVPFRLTPNLSEFITENGVQGPMTSSMIATARCLLQPKFHMQSILKAILKEELHDRLSKEYADDLIDRVLKAVDDIWIRFNCLTEMDGVESHAKTLCSVATSKDSQYKMGVMWQPWL